MGKKNRLSRPTSSRLIQNQKEMKKLSSKTKSKERSADELIELAEKEVADPQKQIVMLTTASKRLRSAAMSSPDSKRKLAGVLGRCAECKVALGDLAGGQAMFLDALSTMGCTRDHLSDVENSNLEFEVLSDAILVSGFCLYLGQLSVAEEALMSYRFGIKLLEASLNNCKKNQTAEVNEINEASKQLCGAYCSVADLFMTDLCFEDNAEKQCEECIRQSTQYDDGVSPDALQAFANLRLSQSRPDEAVPNILSAYQRMKVGCESLATLVGLGTDNEVLSRNSAIENSDQDMKQAPELKHVDEVNALPGYEFRVQTSKLLLECASYLAQKQSGEDTISDQKKCAEAATQVLGSLLAENDEVIEVWYLVGRAYMAMPTPLASEEHAQGLIDAARYYFEHALDMLSKVKKGMEKEMKRTNSVAMNTEELGEINGQINEIKELLKTLAKGSNSDDMEEG